MGSGSSLAGARTVPAVLTVALIARLLPYVLLSARASTTWIFTRGVETGFVAHALLAGKGFASPFGGETGPTALISPGYPLLVAVVFRFFGERSSLSASVILLAQVALGVLTVWLIMRLTAALAGSRAAVLAGSFFALWPPLLWVPTIFWDTSLTLCLVPALLLLAVRLYQRSSRTLWLAFGTLCGLAVLVNLALCLTVAAIFCWAAWNARPRHRDHAVLAACLALLLYAPWPVRNARAFHAFVPLRSTVGLELWMGNRDGATGYLDESVFPLYNRQELEAYRTQGELGYMHNKSTAAFAAMRRHPLSFALLSARRVVRFWLGTGTRGGSAWYFLGAAFTTVCGLAGLFALFRQGREAHSEEPVPGRVVALLLSLPLLLFPLPYYLTHAEFRYRLALEPLLIALTASYLLRARQPAGASPGPLAPEAQASAVPTMVAHA